MNVSTIGRIVFAVPFAVFGLLHLVSGSQMAGMIPSFLPGGVFWVYLTGVALIGASASIIIKKFIRPVSLLLALMLLIFILTIHLPGLGNADAMMQQMAMSGLLKDMGLMGAALIVAGVFRDGVPDPRV